MSDDKDPPERKTPPKDELNFAAPGSDPVTRWTVYLLPLVLAFAAMVLARNIVQEKKAEPQEINRSAASFCDFRDWVGKRVEDTDLEALERPYRIIKYQDLGREMPVQGRINIRLDDGVISDVWCG